MGCTIFNLRLSIALVAGIVLAGNFGADTLAADDVLPMIQFSIKPRLCVLSEGESLCRDELEIKWESPAPRSLCLYRSDQASALECWENKHIGEHRVSVSAANNIDFQLKHMEDQDLLVTEAFEVVQDNSKFRRRRRNAWSFF